jgi:hypothetical protein
MSSPNAAVLAQAIAYVKAGFSVIPIKADGSKQPSVQWAEYILGPPTIDEIKKWYKTEEERGVGIICGKVSGGLEVIDFDQPKYFEDWLEALNANHPDLAGRLTIVKTPKECGRHIYYRCSFPEPGQKLARKPDDKQKFLVCIETRGERQYVLAPGCPASCHTTNRTYDVVSGEFIENGIPIVSDEEREAMLYTARSLNKYEETYVGQPGKRTDLRGRPGDLYSATEEWEKLLEEAGWVCVKEFPDGSSLWRRPGKEAPGISATLGRCTTDDQRRLFYVFSTNAPPFEPNKAYTLFAAHSLLKHGGNFAEAARQLSRDGYGDLREVPEDFIQAVTDEIARVEEHTDIDTPFPLEGDVMRKLEALIENDTKFRKTWNCKRDDLGYNYTRVATSLMYYLRKIFPDNDHIIQCVWNHKLANKDRFGESIDLTAKWTAKTLHWLHHNGHVSNEEKALSSVESGNITEAGEDATLSEIRTRTGLDDFSALIQRGANADCIYYLKFKDGSELQIGGTKKLKDLNEFRDPIMARFQFMMPEMKPYEWRTTVNLMLQVAEIQAGEEDALCVEIGDWLDEFLDACGCFVGLSWRNAVYTRDTFMKDGLLHVYAKTLVVFLNRRRRKEISKSEVCAKLKAYGFESIPVSSSLYSRRTTRSYYQKSWEELVEGCHLTYNMPKEIPEVPDVPEEVA